MAESNPNKTNATTMDKIVNEVRSFRRFKLLQMSEKYFI
jgi:hypothetical protein